MNFKKYNFENVFEIPSSQREFQSVQVCTFKTEWLSHIGMLAFAICCLDNGILSVHHEDDGVCHPNRH